MSELCAANPLLARKVVSTILQRLASVGQRPVADALGVSEATVSRMKDAGIETFAALLAVLGLKVVPAQHQCYDPTHLEHLQYFAKLGMAGEQPPSLEWEDAT